MHTYMFLSLHFVGCVVRDRLAQPLACDRLRCAALRLLCAGPGVFGTTASPAAAGDNIQHAAERATEVHHPSTGATTTTMPVTTTVTSATTVPVTRTADTSVPVVHVTAPRGSKQGKRK
jgi:hypothetical protein